MKNFLRATRLALRHPWTLLGAMACALMVALLWGANIGTVYPFVEVVFEKQSLQDWVAEEIDKSQDRQRNLASEARRWETALEQADPQERRLAQRELAHVQDQLEAEQFALQRYQFLQPYIDQYLPRTPFRTLIWVVALLVAGTFLKDIFLVASSILADRVTNLVTMNLRKEFYRRTLRLDLEAFGNHGTQDLMSRFTYDLDSLSTGVHILLGKAIREPLKALVCLTGAAYICPRLLLFSLLVTPVAVFLINRLRSSLKRANRRAMEEMAQLYQILAETLTGIKLVKAFTMERFERRRFHLNAKQYFRKTMRISVYNALVRPTTELMGISMISLAIIGGAYLVLNQETHLLGIRMTTRPLSTSSLLLFFGLLAGVSDPARKLSEVFAQLQRAAAAADRIYQSMDRRPRIMDPMKPATLQLPLRDLVLENVSFGYSPDKPVLHDINLRVPAARTLAIVGTNGCGKTTLSGLIPRFYDPQAGRILLNGIDLRQLRRQDLRRRISVVTQETMLFDDTVLNNIRYGSPSASREEVIEAARQAHAHRFIEQKLSRGYDTVVGPQGNRLSGGQRQRIALARAILRDPEILILDEATSQIDLESEQLIHNVLERFVRQRMAIIITHRVQTLALAQSILVLDAGRIVDHGTHGELLARCEFYQRLHQSELKESA